MAKIKNYLQQSENQLVCKKDCKLSIDLNDYKINDTIIINDNNVKVNNLISKIEFEDIMFNIILDYPIEIQKINMSKKENILNFEFSANSIIILIPFEKEEIKEQVNYIERLLGGREIFKDAPHLLQKLWKVYGVGSNLDMVHIEILLSQCVRDRSNVQLPARLGKRWDPVMMNIKNIVFNTGFIQGLAFENINQAIQTGIVSEDPIEPSVLERVMTGSLVK